MVVSFLEREYVSLMKLYVSLINYTMGGGLFFLFYYYYYPKSKMYINLMKLYVSLMKFKLYNVSLLKLYVSLMISICYSCRMCRADIDETDEIVPCELEVYV